MPVGEAELHDAWNRVLDRFPFPDYIQIPRGHVEVTRTVARLLPPGSRVQEARLSSENAGLRQGHGHRLHPDERERHIVHFG